MSPLINFKYQPKQAKNTTLVVFRWLDGGSPTSWGHPIARQKAKQKEISLTCLKGSSHFRKACFLQVAPTSSKPAWVFQGWTLHGASWNSLGGIVATNPTVPQRSCHQQGAKNTANLKAYFRNSSFLVWVWFCQVVCTPVSAGVCGFWLLFSWFMTLGFLQSYDTTWSQGRASSELHTLMAFTCFDRVHLSSDSVWGLFQHRKRFHLQMWMSSCQRERSVFLRQIVSSWLISRQTLPYSFYLWRGD